MRGIPGTAFILFLSVIILVEVIAYLSIISLVSNKRSKKNISFIYWVISIGVLAIWLHAFLNPSTIRETENYKFFYFVISLSTINLIPKIVLACFYLASIIPLIFKSKHFSKLIRMSGMIIGFGVFLTIASGIIIERKTIRIETVELTFNELPAHLDGKSLVQVSDMHLGSFFSDGFVQKCARIVNRLSPDLIVFTGDIVNNYYSEMTGFENALAAMKAPLGKYAILGNHDYGDYSNWETKEDKDNNQEKINRAIEKAGFQLLLNSYEKIRTGDTCFYMIGVENWGHAPFPQYANLEKATKQLPESSFKILLSHDPAHWEAKVLPETNIQLTLSGHTHGAQTGFYLAGMEFSPMYSIQKFWGGLYKSDNQYLYVNRGLGCVGFLGRVSMRPEITQIILRSDIIETNRK